MITENIVTRNYFNERAVTWHSSTNPDPAKITQVIADLGLKPGDSVLDVGCGTGVLFPYLLNQTKDKGSIFAIDFARCMTEQAKQNDHRAQVVCSEAEHLPFSNNFFNHILAFQIIPHIQHRKLAIRECWRTLKNSGTLTVFHLNCSRKLNAFHATLPEPVNRHKLPRADELSELLIDAGFGIEKKCENPELYLIRGRKRVDS